MEHPWEDYLLERKVESDLKDLLKTLVAFANSVRPDHKATILIGERDDGTAAGVTNPDNIQKTIRKEVGKIYPPIIWRSHVYEKDGKYCVRVEVEHSGDTPHFGGVAWVRRGSSTVEASEEMFQTLVELRLDMVRELFKWADKEVTVHGDRSTIPSTRETGPMHMIEYFSHRWDWADEAKLIFVNKFWVTLKRKGEKKSEPIEKLSLSYDDEKDRLKIIVAY